MATSQFNYSSSKARKTIGLVVFSIIIAILQILSTFIRFGPFSITLALTPIIIGATVYGSASGTFLGLIMGTVVIITGMLGWDGGISRYLISVNCFGVILICLVKSAAAGWVAGFVYKKMARKSILWGVICACIFCPIVNSGLFILLMLLFFHSTLEIWSGGLSTLYFLTVSLTGINFLIEIIVNLLLSPVITNIIKSGIKRLRITKAME